MAKGRNENFGQEPKSSRFTRRTRGGVHLTKAEVKQIRAERKKLRKEMKAQGHKDKREFELTASSMGLYLDKGSGWFWVHRWALLAGLLGSQVALLGAMYLFAEVTEMRGHFTIRMDSEMFRNGFVLSETEDFTNATTYLFAEPAVDVPCISISHLPDDLDQHDGNHSKDYFAYTFYVRNEGQETVGYEWALRTNSESQDVSKAAWIMLFEDGQMEFFAEANDDGEVEALPAVGDDSRGYIGAPLAQYAKDPDQYELIRTVSTVEFYRVLPKMWESDTVVTSGIQLDMAPMDVHKYTVVIWLEGDDPDCTDDLIGGNLGLEIYMQMIEE